MQVVEGLDAEEDFHLDHVAPVRRMLDIPSHPRKRHVQQAEVNGESLAFHKPGKVPLPQIGTLRVCAALTAAPLLVSCPHVRVTGFCRSFLNF
jgi:hypothetical protein